MAIVFAYLGLAYILFLAFFHPRRRRTDRRDFRSYLLYFAAFFAAFFLAPCLLLILAQGGTPDLLGSVGFGPGHLGRGLFLAALGLPVAVVAGAVGSRDPAVSSFYPFSKEALRSRTSFAAFELAYIFLYYTSWEFLYRGVLFFPLIPAIGLIPALGVETLLSTIYHVGHPRSEVLAAAGAGVLFGLIAFWTGSFLATAILHAAVGVSTDTFIFLRGQPRKPG